MRWPILERVVVAALNAEAGVRAGTKVPAEVDTLPGFLRVSRGPGSDDGVTDSPLVDLEAFAPTQLAAAELAEDARQIMHSLKGRVFAGSLIDTVATSVGPTRVDYSPNVERYVASYRISFRRQ